MRRAAILVLLLGAGCIGSVAPAREAESTVTPGASTPSGATDNTSSAPSPKPSAGAPTPTPSSSMPSPTTKPAPLGKAQVHAYLQLLAPVLVGRVLTAEEAADVAAMGEPALAKVLGAWRKDPGLVDTARMMVSKFLATGGSRDGIDFGLPGNIAAHVAKNELPWSTILTSTSCYDGKGAAIACDTGAPYTAGVLTTRAFMASRIGRFNLTRASALMGTFACRDYPMESELEPRVDRATLIDMFRAENKEEQADDRAANGFGNGHACYTCHGQFSLHAQLFVRFDELGKWQTAATGLQDPQGELGRSTKNLYASHFFDAKRAPDEKSQMLGKPVANLAEAARVMAEHPVFLQCAARKVLEYALDLDGGAHVDDVLLDRIAKRAAAEGSPSFSRIVYETFTDPQVVRTIVASLAVGGAR